MKIALLTLFGHLQRTSSLVNVVAEQLKMLLDANIPTKMLVCEQCADSERQGIFLDEKIEWVKVNNSYQGKPIRWYDYTNPFGTVHSTFYEEANVIAEDMVNHLLDVDVCIVHDILYHSVHLVNNVALRKAQERLPNVRFISYSHSAPIYPPEGIEYPFSCRFTAMPNTQYVTFTQAFVPALSKQYGVTEEQCIVINHSLDILEHLNPAVKNIARQVDLLSSDILIVYPARLTPEKQFEKVAALAGAIKSSTNQSVKVVFCDIPTPGLDMLGYKSSILKNGNEYGLDLEDMVFTSELGYPNGFPREAVFDLFTLSNLFISTSMSESFQLTVIEAAARGNFLVLNRNVPALEELGKQLGAFMIPWDACFSGMYIKENYLPSEEAYMKQMAIDITKRMNEDGVLKAKTLSRKRYSPKWVWENQLAPVLNKLQS